MKGYSRLKIFLTIIFYWLIVKSEHGNSSIALISSTEICRPSNGLATGPCNIRHGSRR